LYNEARGAGIAGALTEWRGARGGGASVTRAVRVARGRAAVIGARARAAAAPARSTGGTAGATRSCVAAIDSLLRVMVLRDAEAMVVTTGQAPSLRRAGNAEPMAMPALDAAMVAGFVADVVPAEARGELEQRRTGEYAYVSAAGDAVTVTVEVAAAGHRLVIRRGAQAAARPAAGAAPAAASSRPAVAPRLAAAPPSTTPPSAYAASSAPPAATAHAAAPPAPAPASGAPPAPAAQAHLRPVPPPAPPAELPATVRGLVAEAAVRHASDLLLSEGMVPHLRVDGDVVSLDDHAALTAHELTVTLAALAGPDAQAELHERGAVDFGADVDDVRLRGHGFGHERGLGVALRLIRRDVPSLQQLGLPPDLARLIELKSGLVLVAGPTGAGKSTTLVALVAHLNRARPRHVITLEDPIEYQYRSERCLIHQREIGVHTPTFADGLRAALREAPDVIVVGELRDRETIAIALTAAETGHLVLGTVHAPGAAVAIDRLIDAYPEHQQRQARAQLAAVLRAVVTQHLLPTRTGGRVPAVERVVITAAIAALIRKNELQMLGAHVQTGRDAGNVPLERNLARLLKAGTIDLATARAAALDPDLLEQSLRGA
jgi:twitching motility protein PilT